jgi:hypothetical protein
MNQHQKSPALGGNQGAERTSKPRPEGRVLVIKISDKMQRWRG